MDTRVPHESLQQRRNLRIARAEDDLREVIRNIIFMVSRLIAGTTIFFGRPNAGNHPDYIEAIGGEARYIDLSMMRRKADEQEAHRIRYTQAMQFLNDLTRMTENCIAYKGETRPTETCDKIYMYAKRRLQNLEKSHRGSRPYVRAVFAITLPEDDWNPQLEPPMDELSHHLRVIIDEGNL